MVTIVDKYRPREFTSIVHDGGIVLCTKDGGAFLCLRFAEDVENLRKLLEALKPIELPRDEP